MLEYVHLQLEIMTHKCFTLETLKKINFKCLNTLFECIYNGKPHYGTMNIIHIAKGSFDKK